MQCHASVGPKRGQPIINFRSIIKTLVSVTIVFLSIGNVSETPPGIIMARIGV
jgi:hypothetical protein